MSWWNHLPEPFLSPNEAYFVDHYPHNIVKAFIAVDYSTRDEEDLDEDERFQITVEQAIQSFEQRWGGLDNGTFLRVLQQGARRDRLAAIFAIGHSDLPLVREVLLPFLSNDDKLMRFASAAVLGLIREEKSIPVLEEYFLQDPPTNKHGHTLREAALWYDGYRSLLARQLAIWGPASLTSLLRKAYLRLCEKDQHSGFLYRSFYVDDALLYALGRRGALSALHGIPLPASRQRLAMIFLALGFLNADELFSDILIEFATNKVLRDKVATILSEHFALSEEEVQYYVLEFGYDYDNRVNDYIKHDVDNIGDNNEIL